jgi:hypothetical protein
MRVRKVWGIGRSAVSGAAGEDAVAVVVEAEGATTAIARATRRTARTLMPGLRAPARGTRSALLIRAPSRRALSPTVATLSVRSPASTSNRSRQQSGHRRVNPERPRSSRCLRPTQPRSSDRARPMRNPWPISSQLLPWRPREAARAAADRQNRAWFGLRHRPRETGGRKNRKTLQLSVLGRACLRCWSSPREATSTRSRTSSNPLASP